MAEEQIKVLNLAKNDVTINLTGFNGKTKPIKQGGFAFLTPDELAYVRNTSIAFEKGTLKVDGNAPEGIDIPNSPNALTNDDIAKMLKQPQKQLALALEEIDNINVVRNILEVAKEQDKSIKVIEIIENRIEELA